MKMFKKLLRQMLEARYDLALIIFVGSIVGCLIIWQDCNLSNTVSSVFLDAWNMDRAWPLLLVLLAIIVVRSLLT